MTDVLEIPLSAAIHQEADRSSLPAGTAIAVENARPRRTGAIGKRPPLVDAGTSVAPYGKSDGTAGTGAPIGGSFSSNLGELAELADGTQALVCDHRVYLRGGTGDAWEESGRAGRALPVSSRWVQYDESARPSTSSPTDKFLLSGVGACSVAATDGYRAVSFHTNDSDAAELECSKCWLVVYDAAGTVVDVKTAGGTFEYPDGRRCPRVLADAAGGFIWLYQEDTGNSADARLFQRRYDPAARTLTAENWFASTKTARNGYDAVTYQGGTEVLVAHRADVDQKFYIQRRRASDWDLLGILPHTLDGYGDPDLDILGDFNITVFGDAAATQIWVAVVKKATPASDGWPRCRVVGFNGSMTAEVADIFVVPINIGAATTRVVDGQAVMTSAGTASSSIWLLVSSAATVSGGSVVTKTDLVKLSLSMGSQVVIPPIAIPHSRLSSRPYNGMTDRFQVWLNDDGGQLAPDLDLDDIQAGRAGWRIQRTACLYTVLVSIDSYGFLTSALLEPELNPDERVAAREAMVWVPEIARTDATDGNGTVTARGLVPVFSPVFTDELEILQDSMALVLYEWEDAIEPSSYRRRVLEQSGGAVVVGGHLQELNRDETGRRIPNVDGGQPSLEVSWPRGFENNWVRAPAIVATSLDNDATADLVGGAKYQLCALYEQVDAWGNRHLSRPSSPVTVVPDDATTKISVQFSIPELSERAVASVAHRTVAHVFMTQGNGSIFYRVTPNTGAPPAIDPHWSSYLVGVVLDGFTDVIPEPFDASLKYISRGEILYTQVGNALPNRPAPAHRFGVRGAGRLWLGGLFNRRMVEVSKLEQPNAALAFTRHPTHRAVLPDPCTGLGFMDDTLVAFTAKGVYTLPAAGAPDSSGSPPLPQFTPIPSTVGCIAWESVQVVPDGMIFQSRRGIYLLPRGFGQPVLISDQVQDELRGRLVKWAAVVDDPGSPRGGGSVSGQNLLVLAVHPASVSAEDRGRLLVYDLDRRTWTSSDDPGTWSFGGAAVASWAGRLAVASIQQQGPSADVRAESPDAWADAVAVDPETGDAAVPSDPVVRITLADVRPFGSGRGTTYTVRVAGEYRGDSRLSMSVSVDGVYSQAIDLDPQELTSADYEPGDKFLLQWDLPQKDVYSLTFDLAVTGLEGEDFNEGLLLHRLDVEVDRLPGPPRVAYERRAA